ncbi:glycosyltransferase family 2 protein [Listeria goaensis]|uniref:glycosyltransferase family 2 protein n=1 Tax=Listeria goaensis TaxID=1649188 RepID=UPI000B58767C|nr:glycosyltransferase [Listeria goaensis]
MKVSVIIPAYNVGEYIEACLDSVMNQSYEKLEVIVINDGSTDDTGEKLALLQEKYPTMQVITKENGGLSAARNDGVRLATGDFIAFVDSDDVIDRDMYKKMMASVEISCADIVTIGVARLAGEDVYRSALHERFMQTDKFDTTIFETPELLYDTTSWNKIYRASFWTEAKLEFPVGKTYEDIPVVIPAYLKAEHVNILKNVGYYWRHRVSGDKSITQQKNNLRMTRDRLDALHVCDEAFATIQDNTLRYKKEQKYLEIDLFSMIEWLFLVKKEDYRTVQKWVSDYMKESLQTNAIETLPKTKQKMFRQLLKNAHLRFRIASLEWFMLKAIKRFTGKSS